MKMKMRLDQPEQIHGKKKKRENKKEIIIVSNSELEHEKNKTNQVATHFSGHDINAGPFSKLLLDPVLHLLLTKLIFLM
jgi:hypothetical protein